MCSAPHFSTLRWWRYDESHAIPKASETLDLHPSSKKARAESNIPTPHILRGRGGREKQNAHTRLCQQVVHQHSCTYKPCRQSHMLATRKHVTCQTLVQVQTCARPSISYAHTSHLDTRTRAPRGLTPAALAEALLATSPAASAARCRRTPDAATAHSSGARFASGTCRLSQTGKGVSACAASCSERCRACTAFSPRHPQPSPLLLLATQQLLPHGPPQADATCVACVCGALPLGARAAPPNKPGLAHRIWPAATWRAVGMALSAILAMADAQVETGDGAGERDRARSRSRSRSAHSESSSEAPGPSRPGAPPPAERGPPAEAERPRPRPMERSRPNKGAGRGGGKGGGEHSTAPTRARRGGRRHPASDR